MIHTSFIRFAPLTTLKRVNDERWAAPRTLYDSGALRFLPGHDTVPLLINHDEERPLGVVRELTRFEDTDEPWLAAIAEIEDPPDWLKHGLPASFAYKNLLRNPDMFGCDVVRHALVTEVSVLTTSKPAEPGARVLTVNPTKKPKPAPTVIRRAAPIARRISPREEDEEFRRRLDFYGDTVPFELVLQNMKDEIQTLKGRH